MKPSMSFFLKFWMGTEKLLILLNIFLILIQFNPAYFKLNIMLKHLHAICKSIFALLLLVSLKATAQPTISSFAPLSGPVGTNVTVTGTNFNAVAANNIVFFGAVKATVTAGNTTSLTVKVPPGGTFQPISVLNNSTGLTGYSSRPFIITFTNGIGIPANYYKPKVDFATGPGPNSVSIGDLDGDGKPDLVTANSGAINISILRNISTTGNINASSFAAKVDFATGNPYFVAIGDLDGDGKPDLVVTNTNTTTISILHNTSTAGNIDASSFAAPIDFTVGTNPISVAIADVDGDGKPDLLVANSTTFNVSVLRNTSTQGVINASSFASKIDFTIGSGTEPVSVATRDLDGDGKLDIVVSNLTGTTLSVLRNTSTKGIINASSFATKVDFTVGNSPYTVAIGDLDQDGKPDLAVPTSSGQFAISVLRNTSTSGTINAGSFAAKVDFITGNNPQGAAIGDLDGDAKPDIVVSNSYAITNSISVFRNTSTPGIIDASSFAPKVDFTTGINPRSVAIGDLDGDGIPEIVAANGNAASNSVSIFQVDLSILPVTLTNVKAYQQNKGVQIEWTAQEEINIDRYELERSQNGQQFEKIGSVEAKGNSNTNSQYNYFDANPYAGTNFYRIKIIEPGHETYSQVLKVNINNSYENVLTIYPNPVAGNMIALQMNLPEGTYTIALYNKLGQQVMNKVITYAGGLSNETIELSSSLAAGIYQLRLSGGGINITRQVIK